MGAAGGYELGRDRRIHGSIHGASLDRPDRVVGSAKAGPRRAGNARQGPDHVADRLCPVDSQDTRSGPDRGSDGLAGGDGVCQGVTRPRTASRSVQFHEQTGHGVEMLFADGNELHASSSRRRRVTGHNPLNDAPIGVPRPGEATVVWRERFACGLRMQNAESEGES